MSLILNWAYKNAVKPFNERDLAEIIIFHPEENEPIKEAVTIETWGKIQDQINLIETVTDELYPVFWEALTQSLIKTQIHIAQKRINGEINGLR